MGGRLVRVRVDVCASPSTDRRCRVHNFSCATSSAEGQPQFPAAGHLHSSMRHTQKHRLVLVVALTTFDITSISVSDHHEAEVRNLRSRRRHLRVHGIVHHHHPPCTHPCHSSPSPSWTGSLPMGCIMSVCSSDVKEKMRKATQTMHVGCRPSKLHHVEQSGNVLLMTGYNCMGCCLIDLGSRRPSESAPCRGLV